MGRVLVDTNVLFPFSIMDVMLALSEDSVHEVLWSQALLAEWERVIVREQRRSAASAASITSAIRDYFPEFEVPESDYAHLIARMPGDDPDDRAHMAAAIAGGADMIVTWNRSDFPVRPLAALGVRVCDPDRYLCDVLGTWPAEVVATIVRLVEEKRRPPLSLIDFFGILAKAGVPIFAERLHVVLNSPGVEKRDEIFWTENAQEEDGKP